MNKIVTKQNYKNILTLTSTLIVALVLFAGCSSKNIEPQPLPIIYEEPAPVVQEESVEDVHWVSKALYKEYDKWCDTPYKYGGHTLKGTDCSYLVQKVYQDAFAIQLPRTSLEQAQIGYEVPKNSSKEGDLVFFKVDSKTRHSGIIIDKGRFLHASTTEGVKISQLNDPYWKSKFLQIRRVLPD
jgi:cell wall-associated NlpC family hydrolase